MGKSHNYIGRMAIMYVFPHSFPLALSVYIYIHITCEQWT